MAKVSFDAVGVAEIVRNLDKADHRLRLASKRALVEGGKVILEAAKEKVGVKSGHLKSVLKIGRRKSTKDADSIEIGAFAGDAPYAHLVEFGHGVHNSTARVPAHPYLEPAFDERKGEALERIAYVMDVEGLK